MEKTDYKDTLNLPQTQMPMRANLTKSEPEVASYWQEINIYDRLQDSYKDNPKYILHDGPPYANGRIHMGHVLNKVLKDIILKYKSMSGSYCPFVPGWDCHGLPVEHQLFKEIGLSKSEISQIEFRKKAKEYALKFVDIQREEFKRLGVFADWDNPYLTLSNDYEAKILESFSKLVEKGFIYKGRKPVNWCYHCETALAEAEVEYNEHKSPSIYVKFRLLDEDKKLLLKKTELKKLDKVKDKEFNFIVWTTTPWTLIANIAIALNPLLWYRFVEAGDEVWIIADSRFRDLKDKVKLDKFQNLEVVVNGDFFEGLRCEHPFINRKSYIVTSNYVSGEDGTGCVHTAPGHGQEDYETWLINKHKFEDFNIIMPVNEKGIFDNSAGEFSGMNIIRANETIINRLEKDKKLVFGEEKKHSYPHCWRCKKPIIFRATEQWFMRVDDEFRAKLIKEIKEKIKWIPSTGMVRILSMIENRPDWCLSRQRYWGVPIPVFYCEKCKEPLLDTKVINHLAQRVKEESLDIWFEKEAHELLPEGTECSKCAHNVFKKEDDILDVWFDSGISHQAVLRQRKDLGYPSQLYLEGSDQHRGWFQTSLISALAIEGQAPYEKVLTHGFIVDAQGKKMSKSLGNAMSPDDVIKHLGADVLRLWVASSDYHNDVNLSEEILQRLTEAYRKVRNTIRFLLGNVYDFDIKNHRVEYEKLFEIDKWALNSTRDLCDDCLKFYESFQLHKVTQKIYNFCTVDLSSFYLDVLKDRLYTWGKNSLGRRSAQTVLYNLLVLLLKLIAPILSFTAEEVWRYTKSSQEYKSIFLTQMKADSIDAKWQNKQIKKKWNNLLRVRELVLKSLEIERSKKVIGNSLEAEIIFLTDNNERLKFLESFCNDLADIFIISKAEIKKVENLPSNVLRSEELKDLAVRVKKSSAPKCPRCWRHVASVGHDKEYKEVCLRCAKAIREAV